MVNTILKARLAKAGFCLISGFTLISLTHYLDFMFCGLIPASRRVLEDIYGTELEYITEVSYMVSSIRTCPLRALTLFMFHYGEELFFVHLVFLVFGVHWLSRLRISYRVIAMSVVCALCFALVHFLENTYGGSLIMYLGKDEVTKTSQDN